jgi:hypothetical protein
MFQLDGCFYFDHIPVPGDCTDAGYYVESVNCGPFGIGDDCAAVCAAGCDTAWYCTQKDTWVPGTYCSDPDVPDNPDNTNYLCMRLADIIISYGGFDACYEDGGVTVCHEVSGPYVTQADCIAAGCAAP